MSHDEYYQTFQTSVIIKHKLSHRNKLLNTMVETFLTIRRKKQQQMSNNLFQFNLATFRQAFGP